MPYAYVIFSDYIIAEKKLLIYLIISLSKLGAYF
jgi:hypothetical protein